MAGTFTNYLGAVKVGTLLVKADTAVFWDPALKRAKSSVEKRGDFTSRPKMFLCHAVLIRMLDWAADDDDKRAWVMLWAVAYVFMLRVPSEALPMRWVGEGADVVEEGQACLSLQGNILRLKLGKRKNKCEAVSWSSCAPRRGTARRPQGSILERRCWCARDRRTCPVHTVGAWAARRPVGSALWSSVTPAGALRELRRVLRELGVARAHDFRTHDWRRGVGLRAESRRPSAHGTAPARQATPRT